jgi:hypothetical protein
MSNHRPNILTRILVSSATVAEWAVSMDAESKGGLRGVLERPICFSCAAVSLGPILAAAPGREEQLHSGKYITYLDPGIGHGHWAFWKQCARSGEGPLIDQGGRKCYQSWCKNTS